MEKNFTPKALIAMSGGVDSSVAAYLAKNAGYDCIAVTMQLFGGTLCDSEAGCSSLSDREDAKKSAALLGIPHKIRSFTADFESAVILPFVRAYEEGRTPNPCVDCNRRLKFGELFRYAMEKGFDKVVTGHYARIEERDGRVLLKKARDPRKDQSYVLYAMTQNELRHTLFPLGDMPSKDEVRAIAEREGFPTAHKSDSQDICFVPDGDYAAFIERYTGKTYPEGDFIDGEGRILGRHRGIIRYTVGQRKGLGLSLPAPLYVAKKDLADNTVTLVPDAGLYTSECEVKDFNWIAFDTPPKEIRAQVKTRYRAREAFATLYPLDGGRVRVRFDAPERAVTAGQALVAYGDGEAIDCDTVLGGGTIC